MEIRRGEIHGLVGESGSGKSTWGKALAGLVPVQARTLELDGVDPRTLGAAERRAAYARVGLVFQDPASSLNPRRTVGWSIGEPLQLAGRSSRAEIGRRVAEALEAVRLPASSASRLPPSSPEASASASRSPAPSFASRPCSSPTSPPAPWTSPSRRT